MKVLKSAAVLLLISSIRNSSAQDVSVYPKRVEIEEGQGFIVSFPPMQQHPWTKCIISLNETTMLEYTPVAGTSQEQQAMSNYIRGNVPAEAEMFSDEENNCGIRVKGITKEMDGRWVFKGQYSNKDYKKDVAVVKVHPKVDKEVCPTSQMNLCLLSPLDSHSEEWTTCGQTKMTDYSCLFPRKGAMKMSEVKVSAMRQQTDEESVTEFKDIKHRKNSMILECTFPKSISGLLKMCTITHRGVGTFNIRDGLQHSRYSSYLTNFEDRMCQFEIPNEFTIAEEGLWTMKMITETSKSHTCKYTVGDSAHFLEQETSMGVIRINTMETETVVNCVTNAPYEIKRCFLVADSNTKFYKDKVDMINGNCQFVVSSKVLEGNEREVTCGFNAPKAMGSDILKRFEIHYHTREVIDEKYKPEEKTLECHHIYKRPIEACLFLSPKGKVYSVPGDDYKSNEFQYHGEGFKTGACGIKFSKAVEEGNWKCVVSTEGQDISKHMETEIYVRNSEQNS